MNLYEETWQIKTTATHFMEGRCRSTTSTAWTGLVLMGLSSSRGSGMLRPVRTSWSMCQLTRDTNLMETLKGRSFPPSPGRVTSRSTWKKKIKRVKEGFKVWSIINLLFRTAAGIQIFSTPLLWWVFSAYPCGCHRQWVGCVQTLLSIINWPAISKDCHLEVLHHGVNHLPVQHEQKHQRRNLCECVHYYNQTVLPKATWH